MKNNTNPLALEAMAFVVKTRRGEFTFTTRPSRWVNRGEGPEALPPMWLDVLGTPQGTGARWAAVCRLFWTDAAHSVNEKRKFSFSSTAFFVAVHRGLNAEALVWWRRNRTDVATPDAFCCVIGETLVVDEVWAEDLGIAWDADGDRAYAVEVPRDRLVVAKWPFKALPPVLGIVPETLVSIRPTALTEAAVAKARETKTHDVVDAIRRITATSKVGLLTTAHDCAALYDAWSRGLDVTATTVRLFSDANRALDIESHMKAARKDGAVEAETSPAGLCPMRPPVWATALLNKRNSAASAFGKAWKPWGWNDVADVVAHVERNDIPWTPTPMGKPSTKDVGLKRLPTSQWNDDAWRLFNLGLIDGNAVPHLDGRNTCYVVWLAIPINGQSIPAGLANIKRGDVTQAWLLPPVLRRRADGKFDEVDGLQALVDEVGRNFSFRTDDGIWPATVEEFWASQFRVQFLQTVIAEYVAEAGIALPVEFNPADVSTLKPSGAVGLMARSVYTVDFQAETTPLSMARGLWELHRKGFAVSVAKGTNRRFRRITAGHRSNSTVPWYCHPTSNPRRGNLSQHLQLADVRTFRIAVVDIPHHQCYVTPTGMQKAENRRVFMPSASVWPDEGLRESSFPAWHAQSRHVVFIGEPKPECRTPKFVWGPMKFVPLPVPQWCEADATAPAIDVFVSLAEILAKDAGAEWFERGELREVLVDGVRTTAWVFEGPLGISGAASENARLGRRRQRVGGPEGRAMALVVRSLGGRVSSPADDLVAGEEFVDGDADVEAQYREQAVAALRSQRRHWSSVLEEEQRLIDAFLQFARDNGLDPFVGCEDEDGD